jgi:hypothetical protein
MVIRIARGETFGAQNLTLRSDVDFRYEKRQNVKIQMEDIKSMSNDIKNEEVFANSPTIN